MEKRIGITDWSYEGDRAKLNYDDGTVLYVSRTDFNRAFGCIVSAEKSVVARDFAI